MKFSVEQECPQCGGQIELEETDRLVHCPFCHVNHFLYSRDYARYYFPPKTKKRTLLYAPYMRFKGVAYFCAGTTINHRIVDVTLQGVNMKQLPLSLGVRPQALKLKFINPDVSGTFLRSALDTDALLSYVGKRRSVTGEGELLHRAYIGEAVSCIYLPLYVESDRLADAITKTAISELPEGESSFEPFIDERPQWHVDFIATLCPNCGWDLQGARDSAVLTCSNCNTVWEAVKRKFVRVNFGVVPGKGERTVYLPFWRIIVEDQTLPMKTFADYIRAIGNPVVIRDDKADEEMSFWIPAFKIRPAVFLRLAGQMTLFQREFVLAEGELPQNMYAVGLPQQEAVQALKIVMASTAWNEKNLFPLLPRIDLQVKDASLVYLPYNDTGQELIQQHKRISVHKNTMKAGRNL